MSQTDALLWEIRSHCFGWLPSHWLNYSFGTKALNPLHPQLGSSSIETKTIVLSRWEGRSKNVSNLTTFHFGFGAVAIKVHPFHIIIDISNLKKKMKYVSMFFSCSVYADLIFIFPINTDSNKLHFFNIFIGFKWRNVWTYSDWFQFKTVLTWVFSITIDTH